MEIKAAEEEIARWKEACELEVEAGKKEIEERNKVVKTRCMLSSVILLSLCTCFKTKLRCCFFMCFWYYIRVLFQKSA